MIPSDEWVPVFSFSALVCSSALVGPQLSKVWPYSAAIGSAVSMMIVQKVMGVAFDSLLKPNNLSLLQTEIWNNKVDQVTWLLAPYITLQGMKAVGFFVTIPEIVMVAAAVGVMVMVTWKLSHTPVVPPPLPDAPLSEVPPLVPVVPPVDPVAPPPLVPDAPLAPVPVPNGQGGAAILSVDPAPALPVATQPSQPVAQPVATQPSKSVVTPLDPNMVVARCKNIGQQIARLTVESINQLPILSGVSHPLKAVQVIPPAEEDDYSLKIGTDDCFASSMKRLNFAKKGTDRVTVKFTDAREITLIQDDLVGIADDIVKAGNVVIKRDLSPIDRIQSIYQTVCRSVCNDKQLDDEKSGMVKWVLLHSFMPECIALGEGVVTHAVAEVVKSEFSIEKRKGDILEISFRLVEGRYNWTIKRHRFMAIREPGYQKRALHGKYTSVRELSFRSKIVSDKIAPKLLLDKVSTSLIFNPLEVYHEAG
jgi:hypothetical protein